jgi:hypothetical protein
MKNNKSVVSLFLVVALFIVIALGCSNRRKYTAQTFALVIRGGNEEVHFSYVVNGKNYDGRSKTKYAVMLGTRGKACYIPSEPEKAYFAMSNEICGQR